MSPSERLPNPLVEHAVECPACRTDELPVERLSDLLANYDAAIDESELSRRALPGLRPALQDNAAEMFERRMVKALLVSVVPLVLVLGYDMFLLELLHGLLLHFLPRGLAAYIVFNYIALVSLVVATTYAAIPLLLAKRSAAGGLREQTT